MSDLTLNRLTSAVQRLSPEQYKSLVDRLNEGRVYSSQSMAEVSRVSSLVAPGAQPDNDEDVNMSDQEERTPSPFFSRHPSPSLPPTTSTALPAALATPAVPAGPVTPSAPARPANLPRRVRERRPVPNHQLSSVRKLDFNLIPPSMRVAGSHSSLSKYRKRKVRSSQIPSDRFLAKKRYTLGEKKYQQVRAGEMSIYDAMGPGYSLQKDPDTELLASIPRAPEIATLPKALRIHYELLVRGSQHTFPFGVSESDVLGYDGFNPPCAGRFAIDWSEKLCSRWNKDARDFFAHDFVLHQPQYLEQYSLPPDSTNPAVIYDGFTTLLHSIQASLRNQEQTQSKDDSVHIVKDKRHEAVVRHKLQIRLKICAEVPELVRYYDLLNAVGIDGMSDEETDTEAQRGLQGGRYRRLYRPVYRSLSFENLVRLLDQIKSLHDNSPLLHPQLKDRDKLAGKRVHKVDSGNYSARKPPVGKPEALYDKDYLQSMRDIGKDLKPSDNYSWLQFPPTISPGLFKNLGLNSSSALAVLAPAPSPSQITFPSSHPSVLSNPHATDPGIAAIHSISSISSSRATPSDQAP